MSTRRVRVDVALVQRGLVDSADAARVLIDEGVVLANGSVVLTHSRQVAPSDELLVKVVDQFVSRGGIKLDAALEADLFRLFQSKFGSPKGFHNDCKQRLKTFQNNNNLAETWSDSCLTPILVMDYINWGGKCAVPQVQGMTLYAGI